METQTTVAPRHFSMIRDFHLADFFTLANGGCGIAAIFLALDFAARGSRNNIYIAAALIIFAPFAWLALVLMTARLPAA